MRIKELLLVKREDKEPNEFIKGIANLRIEQNGTNAGYWYLVWDLATWLEIPATQVILRALEDYHQRHIKDKDILH